MGGRNVVVVPAVDEEHRTGVLLQLVDRGGLLERPAVLLLADRAGTVQDGEGRQVEFGFEVVLVLLPDRGIAAVFHKGPDVFREGVARGHHYGGGTHRHSVKDGKVIFEDAVGYGDALFDIEAVEPAHLDVVAVAEPVVVKVGDEHVEVQHISVHPNDTHIAEMVVGVTVNDYRRTGGLRRPGGRGEDCVDVMLAKGKDCVAENPRFVQRIIPLLYSGVSLVID